MASPDDDETREARAPRLSDLVALCRDLNTEGARYLVIGGLAVIQAGFPRATGDIDLLIDVSPDNKERVRRALMKLPDQAVRDMAPNDLEAYAVVRVADEFVVDLMKAVKDTYREKDKLDRAFLSQLLARRRP